LAEKPEKYMEYGLIFDMDGVLVNSNPFHKIAWGNFLIEKGYPFTDELFDTIISGRTGNTSLGMIMGEEIPEKLISGYLKEIDQEFQQIFGATEESVHFPGLFEFLDAIKSNGIKRALATSAPTGNVSQAIDKLGLQNYFHVIIDKNDVTRGKPDPEVYLTTLARLGVSKANCLVFEDSKAGVQAALAAGLRVIGISSSHTEEELLEEGVTMVIKDFTNLSLNDILNLEL
jgi:HAD superfamily hydrolase (TIGR01509 family)